MATKKRRPTSTPKDFQNHAEERQASLIVELFSMVMENKKWWLIPIVLMVLGLTLVVVLGGSAAAPFIYTLF